MMPINIENLIERIKKAGYVFRFGQLPEKDVMTFPELSQDDLQEIKSFFPKQKFFLFGYARSGTTLLSRLLNLHPDVHASRLGHFVTYNDGVMNLMNSDKTQDWIKRPSMYWNGGKNLSTKVMRSICDFILEKEANKYNKSIVGDKSNNNTINGKAVERLNLIYPDARLIFLVRDGRDVAVSQRIRFFIELPKYLNRTGLKIREKFRKNPDLFLHGDQSIFTRKELKKEALNWAANVIETDEMAKKIYSDQYYSLRFEDLISSPVETVKDIWTFLRADVSDPNLSDLIKNEMEKNPDASWQNEQGENLAENLEKGKSRTWMSVFTERDQEIFEKNAGDTLLAWDYELASASSNEEGDRIPVDGEGL